MANKRPDASLTDEQLVAHAYEASIAASFAALPSELIVVLRMELSA